jgi:hypothetical protein
LSFEHMLPANAVVCVCVFLVSGSNSFTELANSIQNGTHPSPPVNPVSGAMQELQLELQDVITGFETRFRRIKRNGFKAFDSLSEEEVEQDVESLQPLEVSILSVPSEDESDPAAPVFGSEFPVIGRGKAEVEEALARAEDILDRDHGQQEVVGSTTGEANEAPGLGNPATVPSSTPSVLHAEL